MAPREVASPKVAPTPKVQRTLSKSIASKGKLSPSSVKKVVAASKSLEKISVKMNGTAEARKRTNTETKPLTPKSKENKPVPPPGSATKSAKKQTWKRRPKPAHSGVPVPEKMRQLMQKQFQQNLAKSLS